MVQLQILSGKMAGTAWSARRFPFRVGRLPSSDLQLEDGGIWDRHLEVSERRGELFAARCEPNAYMVINGDRVQQAELRNGDLVELGQMRMRFSLSPPFQTSMAVREVMTWIVLVLLSLGQIVLIFKLMR